MRRTIVNKLFDKADKSSKEEEMLQAIFKMANLRTKEEQTPTKVEERLRLTPKEEKSFKQAQQMQELDPEDVEELDKLYDQLYYVNEFKKVELEREKKKDLKEENMILENKISSLENQLMELQARDFK